MYKTKDSLIAWKATVCQFKSPSALVQVDWQHLTQQQSFNHIKTIAENEEVPPGKQGNFHFEESEQFRY